MDSIVVDFHVSTENIYGQSGLAFKTQIPYKDLSYTMNKAIENGLIEYHDTCYVDILIQIPLCQYCANHNASVLGAYTVLRMVNKMLAYNHTYGIVLRNNNPNIIKRINEVKGKKDIVRIVRSISNEQQCIFLALFYWESAIFKEINGIFIKGSSSLQNYSQEAELESNYPIEFLNSLGYKEIKFISDSICTKKALE